MILHRLELENYGAYAGRQAFQLSPVEEGRFARPLVLVRGKNGVGKSTIIEAIRLCLHGSLSLGPSVSRSVYEEHLTSRIHRHRARNAAREGAGLRIRLDYVVLGRKRCYEVKRHWRRRPSGIVEDLDIWEDGTPLSDLSRDQKETLLRELVLPGVAEMFLFDSEKLQLLAADAMRSPVLQDMVTALLGLDLVDRLQRDLDVYLSRQGTPSNGHNEGEYQQSLRRLDELNQQRQVVLVRLNEKERELARLQEAIRSQEQRIARDGGAYAEKYGDLKSIQEHLSLEIERQSAALGEMASGLLPFAICPSLCQRVAERLGREADRHRAQAMRTAALSLRESIAERLSSPSFWRPMGWVPDPPVREEFIGRLFSDLAALESGEDDTVPAVLHASDRDRSMLLDWIARAAEEVPRTFCALVSELGYNERKAVDAAKQLGLVPAEELLAPLVSELHGLHERAACIQLELSLLAEQRRRLDYEHQQAESHVEAYRQKMVEHGKGRTRIALAGKSQTVLGVYREEMLRRKVAALSEAVTRRFKELCRKSSFVDRVEIDPKTFGLRLYLRGQVFQQEELSAGEKQLLATAMLWALRDVSRLPIPVFVDTPVARLDADHRDAMLGTFLPRVSHQTVLLATDRELDPETIVSLAPLVARRYELEYNSEIGSTQVTHHESTPPMSLDIALAREVAP